MARMHGGRRPNEKAKRLQRNNEETDPLHGNLQSTGIFRSRVCYLWNDIQYCRTEDFRKSNDGDFQWTCK